MPKCSLAGVYTSAIARRSKTNFSSSLQHKSVKGQKKGQFSATILHKILLHQTTLRKVLIIRPLGPERADKSYVVLELVLVGVGFKLSRIADILLQPGVVAARKMRWDNQ